MSQGLWRESSALKVKVRWLKPWIATPGPGILLTESNPGIKCFEY
jgi:hypothetical protein